MSQRNTLGHVNVSCWRMHHFGGTASEQLDFRHMVAVTLDHAKFCDMIVDAVERLTRAKG